MDDGVLTIRELIFWGAGFLGVLTLKFLAWFMPETASLWVDKLRKMLTKDISKEVCDLSKKVDILIIENSSYKKEKHKLKGELVECIDAIKSDDTDKLKVLKEHYIGEDMKAGRIEIDYSLKKHQNFVGTEKTFN